MASTWSNLKFELIGTGDQSGTWGATTNDNIGLAIEQAIGGKADVTMSSTSETLSLTDTTALQNARALYLNLTGTPGGAATLNVPAVQKAYIVYNNTTGGFAVTVKVSGQTGVSVPNGKTMVLYDNGTDVVDAITHLSSLTLGSALPIASGGTGTTSTTFVNLATNVTGTLPVGNGGTGATTLTANNVILGNGTSAVQFVAPGTTGNVLTSNGTTWTSSAGASFATPLTVVGNATAGSEIRLPEDTDNGSNYAAVKAPDSLASNVTLTLPSQTATLGYINIPQSGSAKTTAYTLATGDVGEFIEVGSGGSIEIPDATFSAGDAILIFNNTSGGITITCTITTAYIAGTDTDKATVTLATRGIASILFASGTVCVITGNVS
jgi:hypothetical protein